MKISKENYEFVKAIMNEMRTEELEYLQNVITDILRERNKKGA